MSAQPPGSVPFAVADLTHQKHPAVDEGGPAHIDFRRRVPAVLLQDGENGAVVRAGALRQHAGRQFAQPLITLAVEAVPR